MKRYHILAMALLCACLLAGCGREAASAETDSPPVTREAADDTDVLYLSMATVGNWEGTLRGELFDEYCEKLKEWSGGKMVMKHYYGGTLGNDLELMEGVRQGTLTIVNLVPSYQIAVVPQAALLDIPGMFESVEEYNYFIDHYYYDTMQSYYEAQGIRLLSCHAFTSRQLTSNVDIRSMEDFKRLKLRTMENPYNVSFWQHMGATALPLGFQEFRLSVQQGVLQAQENPLGYIISENMLDVQGYVILTNHIRMVSSYLMNGAQYDALSQEQKDLLNRFMTEMDQELIEKEPEDEAVNIERIKEQGIVVHDASADILAGINAGRDVVIEMLRKELGDAVVDDFITKLNAARESFPG